MNNPMSNDPVRRGSRGISSHETKLNKSLELESMQPRKQDLRSRYNFLKFHIKYT